MSLETTPRQTAELQESGEVNPDIRMLTPSDLTEIRLGKGTGPEVRLLQRLERAQFEPSGGTVFRQGSDLWFDTYVESEPRDIIERSRGELIGSPHNKPAWAGGGINTRFQLMLGPAPDGVDVRELMSRRAKPPAGP
jgi:hypothetical protein